MSYTKKTDFCVFVLVPLFCSTDKKKICVTLFFKFNSPIISYLGLFHQWELNGDIVQSRKIVSMVTCFGWCGSKYVWGVMLRNFKRRLPANQKDTFFVVMVRSSLPCLKKLHRTFHDNKKLTGRHDCNINISKAKVKGGCVSWGIVLPVW